VESWAVGDRITSTRSAVLPSSQTPSAARRASRTSRLARSYSAEAAVDCDLPDNESDVAAGDIDCDVRDEQRRRKTKKERRTELPRYTILSTDPHAYAES
jgi:hypothetical protein